MSVISTLKKKNINEYTIKIRIPKDINQKKNVPGILDELNLKRVQ